MINGRMTGILLEIILTALTLFCYVGQDFCHFNLTFLAEVAALDMNFMKTLCLQHYVNIFVTEP
jgi:hypothetical protein